MHSADDEVLEAAFSDYCDGAMSPDERRAFEERLAAEPALREQLEVFRETRAALSGLHRMSAPQHFERGIEDTIHRRSAGRFFGRRAFGERVPFELLAVLALALMLGVYLLIRLSDTGSAKPPFEGDRAAPQVAPEAQEVIPKP